MKMWTGIHSGQCPVPHGYELPDSIKAGEIFGHLSDYQILKQDYDPFNYVATWLNSLA